MSSSFASAPVVRLMRSFTAHSILELRHYSTEDVTTGLSSDKWRCIQSKLRYARVLPLCDAES